MTGLQNKNLDVQSAAKPNWVTLALILSALIVSFAVWNGPGMINTRAGGDSPFLLIRTQQLVENLRAGVFPARWMPDAAYGLGYPFFNFYAALPFYFSALFNLIGFDLLASIKIVQSLGFVFAALAMYGWARSVQHRSRTLPSENASFPFLTAIAYTFAPFHMVNVYVRGDSLSEFYAFVFYPLILWAVDHVIDQPRPRSIVLLAVAYAGLILTHNVSALIFSPFVLLYIFFRAVRKRHFVRKVANCSLGLVLAFLLSSWLWLPALGEAHLVQLDVQTSGYFNYSGHFRTSDLVQSSLVFDYNTEPPHTPFAMGLMQTVATIAGVLALIVTRRGPRGFRLFILLGLIVSTAMITPASKFLWDTLPLLPLTQFPWRFLSVQALFTSLAIGYLVYADRRPLTAVVGGRWSAVGLTRDTLTGGIVGLILAASALLALRPAYLAIRADEVTAQRIQLYEAFTTNIGTTIRAEYLPRATIPRPFSGPRSNAPLAIRGEAQARQTARGPVSQSWMLDTADGATLAFPTLYFPGWQASLDGQLIETRAANDLGYIEIDVPRGEYSLELWFDRTPLRALAEGSSFLGVLLVGGLLVADRRTAERRRQTSGTFVLRLWSFVSTQRYTFILSLIAIASAAIVSAANSVDARSDDLMMDFESRPWLHHSSSDDFGDMLRLARYTMNDALVAANTFEVSIEWSDVSAADLIATLQLVTPSQHVFDAPQPLASVSLPIQAGLNMYSLQVPDKLSRGMYYVRVEVSDASGVTRSAYLRPIAYVDAIAAPDDVRWARIGDVVELSAVYIQHSRSNLLTFTFDWVALRQLTANYALSLRLHDDSGRRWATLDTQPGYGFQPSSTWTAHTLQRDIYTLELPEDLPRDLEYMLDVVWYRVASLEEIGRVRVPHISVAQLYESVEVLPPYRTFEVPPMQQHVDAIFDDTIRLLGFDMTQQADTLNLTLHWQALTNIDKDYEFFIHIFDPSTERIAAQVDGMPHGNAYPTSNWVEGEIVSETFVLAIDESGTYRLATGWFDPLAAQRLTALDAAGRAVSEDRVILVENITRP